MRNFMRKHTGEQANAATNNRLLMGGIRREVGQRVSHNFKASRSLACLDTEASDIMAA
jgi:hypothetical protein